ncbi:hypothetical protein HYT57_02100 [Candidatus Woesearchaeota archaeon]|nr:hypothetical protein [Candidatus Woesearchaeota archaeon]
MNKHKTILGTILVSSLLGCNEPHTETEIYNDTLRVENVWMRSDGRRIVEYVHQDGIAHILREGSHDLFSGRYNNIIQVKYIGGKKLLVHTKRDSTHSRHPSRTDYFTLCLPNNYKIRGLTTEEGGFLDRRDIDVYNIENDAQKEIGDLEEREILNVFRTSNPTFNYPPMGSVQRCSVSFRVREIYLTGFMKHRSRKEWERFNNSGVDEIAELSGFKELSDTDILVLCIDKEGRHYAIGAGMLLWGENKYNTIILKSGGRDTTLTLESRIISENLRVDNYTLTVPEGVTLDSLKKLDLGRFLQDKQPEELYKLVREDTLFIYDGSVH